MENQERKTELVKGQKINVDIFKGRKGNFPVGKHGTIICKLFIPKSVGHIDFGCTCLCRINEVEERSLSVTILEVVKSAAANNFELQEKLKSVSAPDQKKEKIKKNFAFAEALEKASKKLSKP